MNEIVICGHAAAAMAPAAVTLRANALAQNVEEWAFALFASRPDFETFDASLPPVTRKAWRRLAERGLIAVTSRRAVHEHTSVRQLRQTWAGTRHVVCSLADASRLLDGEGHDVAGRPTVATLDCTGDCLGARAARIEIEADSDRDTLWRRVGLGPIVRGATLLTVIDPYVMSGGDRAGRYGMRWLVERFAEGTKDVGVDLLTAESDALGERELRFAIRDLGLENPPRRVARVSIQLLPRWVKTRHGHDRVIQVGARSVFVGVGVAVFASERVTKDTLAWVGAESLGRSMRDRMEQAVAQTPRRTLEWTRADGWTLLVRRPGLRPDVRPLDP